MRDWVFGNSFFLETLFLIYLNKEMHMINCTRKGFSSKEFGLSNKTADVDERGSNICTQDKTKIERKSRIWNHHAKVTRLDLEEHAHIFGKKLLTCQARWDKLCFFAEKNSSPCSFCTVEETFHQVTTRGGKLRPSQEQPYCKAEDHEPDIESVFQIVPENNWPYVK